MPLEPDRDQIELFVDALFRHASPGAFLSLRAFYEDRGEARPFIIVPVKLNGDFTVVCNIVTDAARTAANATEKVVFAPPLVTFHDARKATEKDIADAIVLSVECDARPQQSREKLEAMLGPATVVTRSGGRWIDPKTGASYDKLHLHWRLAEPATGKADLARLRRARNLACRIVGADPSGKSIVHPYRWPGSWHRKAEPRLCEIEHAEPDHEIVLEEALEHLEDAAGAVRDGDGGGLEHHAREGYRVEWEDAFRTILTGESYHPTLVPLAASFAAWGMPEPAALRPDRTLPRPSCLARCLSGGSAALPRRYVSRWGETGGLYVFETPAGGHRYTSRAALPLRCERGADWAPLRPAATGKPC
jgi:hypothetical protein